MTETILKVKDIRNNPSMIVEQALTEPGTIAGCYSLFHNFSAGNVVGFKNQLKAKGLPITPVMSSKDWVKKGYITEEQRRKHTKSFMWGLLPVTERIYLKDDKGNTLKDKDGKDMYYEDFKYFKMAQA